MNTLTTIASETVRLKDLTRCLLDCSADGYNRQIQTEGKQTRARRTAELAEIAEVSRHETEEIQNRQQ
jgi:hypothetical protein